MPKGPNGQKRKADVIGTAACATDRLWDIGDIAKLIEEWEAQA